MNKLKGKITNIKFSGSVSIVEVDVNGQVLKAVVLETPKSSLYLKQGNDVNVIFKETEVSIGKNFYGDISLSNKIQCKIIDINKGKLLSKLKLEFKDKKIESVITTDSLERMNLKIGEDVVAFIKANEVSIMET